MFLLFVLVGVLLEESKGFFYGNDWGYFKVSLINWIKWGFLLMWLWNIFLSCKRKLNILIKCMYDLSDWGYVS